MRYIFTQEETFMTFIRPAYKNRMRTGVKKDGTIVARHNEFWVDVGGYAISGARSANNTLKVATGPYRIPNARVDCYAVYTNKPPSSPYRGLPTTQHTMSYEAQFDRIARDLGIDRLEIRRRNLVRDGDIHITGDYLRSAHSHEMPGAGDRGHRLGRAAARRPGGEEATRQGVSCTIKYTLTPAREMSENSAEVALGEDGVFEVRIGTVNIGQGSDTVMAQIAGDALGVGLDAIRIVHSDTGRVPVDSSTTASRSTYHMGRAVVEATDNLKPQMLEAASQLLERDTESLVFTPGGIETPDGTPGVTYDELVVAWVRRSPRPAIALWAACTRGRTATRTPSRRRSGRSRRAPQRLRWTRRPAPCAS